MHLSPSAEYFCLFSTKIATETAKGDGWRSWTLLCKEDSASYMALANIIYVKPKMPLSKIKLSSSQALPLFFLWWSKPYKNQLRAEKWNTNCAGVIGPIIHKGPAFNQYGNSCLPAVIAYVAWKKVVRFPRDSGFESGLHWTSRASTALRSLPVPDQGLYLNQQSLQWIKIKHLHDRLRQVSFTWACNNNAKTFLP